MAKDKKKVQGPKPLKEDRELPDVLTVEEKAAKAMELADAIGAFEKLTAEKKQIMATYKTRLDLLSQRIVRLGRQITDGCEMRLVECEITFDRENLSVKVVRLDTEEVVEEREMTEDEKQMCMDF